LEKPVFAMPMWVKDQFIVTPEGETPPRLDDRNLSNLGEKRAGRLKAYKKAVSELKLVPGPTYTFCMWGMSPWCDVLYWHANMLGGFSFNEFCGRAPLHYVMYSLRDNGKGSRHVPSNREVIVHFPFWSSVHPPTIDGDPTTHGAAIDQLLKGAHGNQELLRQTSIEEEDKASLLGSSSFTCCMRR